MSIDEIRTAVLAEIQYREAEVDRGLDPDDEARATGNLNALRWVAGLLPEPAEERVIPVGEDGRLTCTCGGHEFKENGSHPCDWDFKRQEPGEKTLVFYGSFEWYEGTFESYECTACGKDYDALPEGWTTDYA